jgi:hypothetical protein
MIADHSIHIMAMSEDLPDPESRVPVAQRRGQAGLAQDEHELAHDLLVAR